MILLKGSHRVLYFGLCLALLFSLTRSTFSDIEAGLISVQKDTLSWPQVGLLKMIFLILLKMWIHGVLPIQVDIPLPQRSYNLKNDFSELTNKNILCQRSLIVNKDKAIFHEKLCRFWKSIVIPYCYIFSEILHKLRKYFSLSRDPRDDNSIQVKT